MDLGSTRYEVTDEHAASELFLERGWTDGLPVVAPTASRVQAMLDAVRLAPGDLIGAYDARATALTAEKLAVNAVMAGCLPEYMPLLVAAFEGLTDPDYHMNHMASLGSPWPLLVVNGPIARELGMHHGQYVLGPTGNRANATIGRAVSLALANCFGAKVGGVQRGCMGNPHKWSFCIAENEAAAWEPLHVARGFRAEDSTVTVFGSMDGFVQFVTPNYSNPDDLAELMAQKIAYGMFCLGSYVVLMAPTFQQHFVDAGWTKADLKEYLVKNVKRSVASLKIDGKWERFRGPASDRRYPLEPGDDERMVRLYDDPTLRGGLWHGEGWPGEMDYLIVVCGGEAGNYGGFLNPYPSAVPVTKKVHP